MIGLLNLFIIISCIQTHAESKNIEQGIKKTESSPALEKTQAEKKEDPGNADKPKEDDKLELQSTESWKFKFSGWVSVEHETIENFGEAVTKNFTSSDRLNAQTDTNLLANLQFNLEKEELKFDSVFEIGEIFYGDSSTGGNQGLRGKNIEIRNFNFEEKYDKDWYFKVGLWTVNADPRGFILSDHHAAAQIKYESESSAAQLWVANAVDSKPGTVVAKDIYIGLNYNKNLNEKNNINLFLTQRSTRETFLDNDLVTLITGASTYVWLGVHSTHQDIFEKTNFEFNLIGNKSEFKAEAGGSKDSNSAWLGHARIDRALFKSWDLGLDLLGTSGTSDSRVSGVQVVGRRQNFASPNPSAAYLLTVATNDGGDDAAGSVRGSAANQIARLDLGEGLRLAVLSLNKDINERWSGLVRLGKIQSASENTATRSNDYGSEIDLKVKFKSSRNTAWIFEAGVFTPGKYFVDRDPAKLVTIKYKVDF